MKPLLLTLSILALTSNSYAKTQKKTSEEEYKEHVRKMQLGSLRDGAEDAYDAVAVPVGNAAEVVADHTAKVAYGIGARMTWDAVSLSSKLYKGTYAGEKINNKELAKKINDQAARKDAKDDAETIISRMDELSKGFTDDSKKFTANIRSTLQEITKSSAKLEGWDAESQKNMVELLDAHKEIGSLTAEDGKARVGAHTLAELKGTWIKLETAIKKNKEASKKAGLDAKMKKLSKYFKDASERAEIAESKFQIETEKLNALKSVDEQAVSEEIGAAKREMALVALNNSVGNLISDLRFSGMRSKLAFAHFNDIATEIDSKNVKADDIKNGYRSQSKELAAQYNNTPIGVYVNNQISKAMGSVCELVNNQCSDGSNAKLFDFLDDTSRSKLKLDDSAPAGAEAASAVSR